MKPVRASAKLRSIGMSLFLLSALFNHRAMAVEVTYKFSSTVSSITPSASGFPASLNGVNAGDPISGTIHYDAASPAATNTQGVGNTILPASTFSSEALPSGPVTGIHIAELGTPNSVWLDSGLFNLTQAVSVVGDYDGDGLVTQQDYQVWRAHFAATNNLAADGNGNGVIDAADYVVWRNALGHGAGNGAIVNGAVPEPATIGIFFTGAIATLLCRMATSNRNHCGHHP